MKLYPIQNYGIHQRSRFLINSVVSLLMYFYRNEEKKSWFTLIWNINETRLLNNKIICVNTFCSGWLDWIQHEKKIVFFSSLYNFQYILYSNIQQTKKKLCKIDFSHSCVSTSAYFMFAFHFPEIQVKI